MDEFLARKENRLLMTSYIVNSDIDHPGNDHPGKEISNEKSIHI